MSDKILKVGVVGCGGIANGKHLPALSNIKEVELVAFCDIILEKAEEAAEKYGVEGAKSYKDYKEFLKDNDLDVVHVCTPNKSHSEITVASLEAGSHVMCEKPMAKTSEEAKAMIDAAKRTGKKLAIGYQYRMGKGALYLKQVCDRGDLGEIYYAKARALRRRAVPTWGVFLNEEEQGGGPLIDIGTHALDMTLWMMNNYEPEMVVGTKYHKLGPNANSANAWGPWDPKEFTVEDSAFGFIKMKNGATIVLESSWALNMIDVGEAQTVLCGTKAGADMLDGLRINGEDMQKMYIKTPDLASGGVAFFDGDGGDTPSDIEARLWIDAILKDTDPVVLPEQAFVVTQILEAIYESAETGKPVYFN